MEEEVSNFKLEVIIIGCPIIRSFIWVVRRWWCIERYVIATLITDLSYK